jgi:endoglucanase
MGVNLCGMDSKAGIRYGGSTLPNVNFTVPRSADVAWLKANGYTKTRLPIVWEMLQPMLHDTVANAQARDAIGEPGAFHPGYESYITGLLNAHAAAGIKCIIDLHNYCRYQDFVFQPDGSVIGLVKPPNPLIRAFTSDNTQVQTRIFALAPGATLKQSNFTDFWTRVAQKWKNHAGFGGYNLMNEPYHLPRPGQTADEGTWDEDLTIWPAYAQAAINAIRAVDGTHPIYLGGNIWSSAMSIDWANPGWPGQVTQSSPLVTGSNLIYEVHFYLDAGSNGQHFDYDTEFSRGFNAGLSGPMTQDTGVERLKIAVDWAKQHGVRLALMETGMPIDDPRWQDMFQRTVNYARQSNVEVFSWNGGSHWAYRNAGIHHVPGWHQNKTLEPPQSGPLKMALGISGATLFADGGGWAPSGGSVTITVYARGNLTAPVTVAVSSNNGGTFSKSQLTIPAGANGQDSFTFTPLSNRVTTLSFASSTAGVAAPPARKVYSLTDPVGHASINLADAAMALIAKYNACKWDLADGYTDYLQGVPAGDGQVVRAIADSGYGSSPGNAMEMLNWLNTNPGMGTMVAPVMRVTNGRKNSDHSAYDTTGFWCRKSIPVHNVQEHPRNVVPYRTQDPHFAIAAVSVPGLSNTGILFQASHSGDSHCSELTFSNSQPQAKWIDPSGQTLTLTSPTRLIANTPAVVSFSSRTGRQVLRVNRAEAASATMGFFGGDYNQMLLGWGYQWYYPRSGFGGNIYSAITGRGEPSASELDVMERYLGTTAGI